MEAALYIGFYLTVARLWIAGVTWMIVIIFRDIIDAVRTKWKPKKVAPSNAGIDRAELAGAARAQLQHIKDLAVARALPPEYVLLTPRVPMRGISPEGSWFGGPRLPDDVSWPKIDGVEARFLCQINCAALPAGLWNGAGPRSGWLVFFCMPEWPYRPAVLHVHDPCRPRSGPEAGDAEWFKPREREAPLHRRLPAWAVDLQERHELLPPERSHIPGYAPGLPHPRKGEVFALADPAFRPRDRLTLGLLIEAIEADLDRYDTHVRSPEKREPDATFKAAFLDPFASTRARFAAVRAAAEAPDCDVPALVDELAGLTVERFERMERDEYTEDLPSLRLIETPLGGPISVPSVGVTFPWRYNTRLYDYVKHACSRGEPVPEAVLARFEALWRFEARHEGGAMGHIPSRHVYTDLGDDAPEVVLLELESGDLNGWIWGDVCSLVIFIRRDDLAAGRFDQLTCEISN